jgi:hypothetical protein
MASFGCGGVITKNAGWIDFLLRLNPNSRSLPSLGMTG